MYQALPVISKILISLVYIRNAVIISIEAAGVLLLSGSIQQQGFPLYIILLEWAFRVKMMQDIGFPLSDKHFARLHILPQEMLHQHVTSALVCMQSYDYGWVKNIEMAGQ